MDRYFTIRRALCMMCLLVPALGGCQTVAGFGRDVQRAGGWITGGAERTETWAFGPQGQAAEAQNTNASMSGTSGMAAQKSITPVDRAPEAGDHVVYFATGSADIPSNGMDEIRSIASAAPNSSGQISDTNSMQNSGNSSGQSASNNAGQSFGSSSAQNTGQSARFQVTGYTDTAGPAAYNRTLSQRRAQAVADALAAQGVPRGSIDVQWHGEDQLPVPTADGVPEPQNRSVSIAMTGG
jgi:predicted small secreted protein